MAIQVTGFIDRDDGTLEAQFYDGGIVVRLSRDGCGRFHASPPACKGLTLSEYLARRLQTQALADFLCGAPYATEFDRNGDVIAEVVA